MKNFKEVGLPPQLMQSLDRLQFTVPTPIQAQAIPAALEGKDVLGSAQTGTGKTLAFTIPMVAKLLSNPRGSALVMTPTRELATQVMQAVQQLLGKHSNIKTALLIGGESMPRQVQQLRARPRIFIGTPGRINDHLARGNMMLHDTNFLVLDETDRMLDMGFGVQIERIARFLTANRQTLMFSATLPANIVKLSQKYLKHPVRISVGSTNAPLAKIKQEIVHTSDEEKYGELLNQLNAREGSIVIFVKTKHGADRLATKLCKKGMSAEAIHGDLRQSKRDKVIAAFRSRNYRILVATDVAARGLDIPHIEHVINYDLPQSPEDYIHRIGRTARAGAEGSAVCLITAKDSGKWRAIQKLINPGQGGDEGGSNSSSAPSSKKGGGYKGGNNGGGNRKGGKPFRFKRRGNRNNHGGSHRQESRAA